MARLFSFTLLVAIGMSASMQFAWAKAPPSPAGAGARATAPSKKGPRKDFQKAEFEVLKASCLPCLRAIERTIRTAPGVERAHVDAFKPYKTVVIYDPKKTNPALFLKQMRKDGYDVTALRTAKAEEKDLAHAAGKPAGTLEEYNKLMTVGTEPPEL